MGRPIDYHIGARVDFDQSFDWYAERSVGAAIGFLAAVDQAIEKMAAHPGRFPQTSGDCRYCALKKYPFRVVFHEEATRIVVVAIAHAKREPEYWRNRV